MAMHSQAKKVSAMPYETSYSLVLLGLHKGMCSLSGALLACECIDVIVIGSSYLLLSGQRIALNLFTCDASS